MSATAETVRRRVRGVLGSAGLERLDPGGARLVVGKVLFDGHGIPDWHHHAACQAHDPELFFADPSDTQRIQTAKRICTGCPVRSACLADAMAWEQPSSRYGVVGGLSAQERRQLHRTRESAKSGGCMRPRCQEKLADFCEVCGRLLISRPVRRTGPAAPIPANRRCPQLPIHGPTRKARNHGNDRPQATTHTTISHCGGFSIQVDTVGVAAAPARG
jgi:WhiB family redox-sensing transcriptional regulator